ncbi:MAG TPA: DUF4252 domain-containing protein [Thermoanaerobaculia bacterium]|jgi:hypothetical protein|nr:DUF4252 domain-containing protein [Thermoanaerobaculia bacterium]
MKRSLVWLFMAALALPASAQQINLDFPGLSERAAEEVTVTLDARMLRLASKFLSDDRDERTVRDMIQKLEGIYVRSYEFDREGEYDRSVVDRVRSQLGTNWNKIVNVRSRTRENVEIYTQTRGDAITGLVVISAEPRELTIVNIVGSIDLDRLADLEGQFGIPKISKERKER